MRKIQFALIALQNDIMQGVSKIDATNNMIMIYYWDKCNGGHLEHVL